MFSIPAYISAYNVIYQYSALSETESYHMNMTNITLDVPLTPDYWLKNRQT